MATDLTHFIRDATVVDTHEHMCKESTWTNAGPRDVLEDLFRNYVVADLINGGAAVEAVDRLVDGSDPDVEGRWLGVAKAWQNSRHTGYGQGVALVARHVYGIEEIGPDAVRSAQPKLEALRQGGERLRLLRDLAKLDHIQILISVHVKALDQLRMVMAIKLHALITLKKMTTLKMKLILLIKNKLYSLRQSGVAPASNGSLKKFQN